MTSGARRSTGMSYAAVLFVTATLDTPAMPEVIARRSASPSASASWSPSCRRGASLDRRCWASTSHGEDHRVFAKTGTARQADLVRLIAGFASPLVR